MKVSDETGAGAAHGPGHEPRPDPVVLFLSTSFQWRNYVDSRIRSCQGGVGSRCDTRPDLFSASAPECGVPEHGNHS